MFLTEQRVPIASLVVGSLSLVVAVIAMLFGSELVPRLWRTIDATNPTEVKKTNGVLSDLPIQSFADISAYALGNGNIVVNGTVHGNIASYATESSRSMYGIQAQESEARVSDKPATPAKIVNYNTPDESFSKRAATRVVMYAGQPNTLCNETGWRADSAFIAGQQRWEMTQVGQPPAQQREIHLAVRDTIQIGQCDLTLLSVNDDEVRASTRLEFSSIGRDVSQNSKTIQ